jgi:NAD-dependent SIR2 family protein deacetylase
MTISIFKYYFSPFGIFTYYHLHSMISTFLHPYLIWPILRLTPRKSSSILRPTSWKLEKSLLSRELVLAQLREFRFVRCTITYALANHRKDFQSGLYNRREPFSQRDLESSKRSDTIESLFQLYKLSKESEPTIAHKFFKKLNEMSKLRRLYTQNVDSLDELVGLSASLANPKCVQLHGTNDCLKCPLCHSTEDWEGWESAISQRKGLPCSNCTKSNSARVAQGKRSLKIGQLQPSIEFSGQVHSQGEKIFQLTKTDIASKPDLLLVFGTSLKVYGPRMLFKKFARAIRSNGGIVVFVNLEKPSSECSVLIDYWVDLKCDDVAAVFMDFIAQPTKESKKNRRKPALQDAKSRIFKKIEKRKKVGATTIFDAGSTPENPIML